MKNVREIKKSLNASRAFYRRVDGRRGAGQSRGDVSQAAAAMILRS